MSDYQDNLLPMDQEDRSLLECIFAVKREAGRLGRERSEDALTFNVFRTIERQGFLDAVLSAIADRHESDSIPSYWSFSPERADTHPMLAAARKAFGEADGRGSEPHPRVVRAGHREQIRPAHRVHG